MEVHKIKDYPRKQSKDQVIVRDQNEVYLFSTQEILKSPYGPYLQDVCTFAQLCAEVYVDDDAQQNAGAKSLSKNQNPDRWHDRAAEQGWKKQPWQAPLPSRGYNLKSLKYALWLDKERKRALVVFRGTATKMDWWSNANWLTRFVPGVNNHYKQVHQIVEPTIEFIKSELGDNFELYTTGHSLGGGLAQLFAYASNHRAKLVCAFHSSPVTGYFLIPKAQRQAAGENLYIARVFEHGEVLSYFRLATRKLYPVTIVNPRISEYRTNFISGGVVTQHSIATFADQYYQKLRSTDLS